MEELIGGAIAAVGMFVVFGLAWGALLPVTYIVLRWRFDREEGIGPHHFGLQCVFWVLMSLGIQALVLSLAMLFYAILEDPGEEFMRIALGLGIGSIVLTGILALLVRFTLQTHPRITRTYLGLNLFYVGSTAAIAILFFFVVLLQEKVSDRAMSLSLAALVVYLLASGVLAYLVRRADQAMGLEGGGGGGGRTQAMHPV